MAFGLPVPQERLAISVEELDAYTLEVRLRFKQFSKLRHMGLRGLSASLGQGFLDD